MLELELEAAATMKISTPEHCLHVMHDPDYPAYMYCTVFAKGLIESEDSEKLEVLHSPILTSLI